MANSALHIILAQVNNAINAIYRVFKLNAKDILMLIPFLQTYLLLFGLGIGLSCFINHHLTHSNSSYRKSLTIIMSPLIGYAIVSIAGVYTLNFEIDRNLFALVFEGWLVISIIISICYLHYRPIISSYSAASGGHNAMRGCQGRETQFSPLTEPGDLFPGRSLNLSPKRIPVAYSVVLIVFSILLIGISLNNYHDGIFYHSLNPDVAAYTVSADWFANTQLPLAKIVNSFEYEIVRKSLRWGLVSVAGALMKLLQLSSYSIIFPIVITIFLSGIATIALLFDLNFNTRLAAIVTLCTLLNGGLLYFLSEAFYPYIIGVAFISALIGLLVNDSRKDAVWPKVILGSLFAAAILTTCSELYLLVIAIIVGAIFFKLIINERPHLLFNIKSLAIIGGSILLVLPLSCKLVMFTIANIGNKNNIGYIQPNWAWLSDVLGLTSMYFNLGSYISDTIAIQFTARSLSFGIISFALSIWGLYELCRWRKNALFLTLFFGALGFFVVNKWFIYTSEYPPYNYFYDKLVMVFAPAFICFFFASIVRSNNYRIKLGIAIMSIFISGFGYLIAQHQFLGYVDITAIQAIKTHFQGNNIAFITLEQGYRQGVIKGKLRYIDRASDIIIDSMLDNRLIEQREKARSEYFKSTDKVFIIAKKSSFSIKDKILKKYKHRIVFDTRSYYVFDSGKTAADIFTMEGLPSIKKLF